jgi:hypothetical protein
MRLLAHLLFADLRRHRWLLGLWLAVLAASTVVDGMQPVFAAQRSAATFDLLAGLLTIIRLLLRILLIVLVVQTHSLVGTDAFWLTRPIPRLTLLVAKTIVLAVFLVVIPAAAEAILMTAYGILPGEIVRVAAESTLYAAFWVALLSTAAALTPTFARFVLLCGGVLATLALYIAIQITIGSIAPSSPPPLTVPPAEDYTIGVVLIAGLIVACAITLFAQYRSRRLWVSGLIAVVAVFVAVFIVPAWPWAFLQAHVERPAWTEGAGALPIVAQTAAAHPNEPGMTTSGNVAQRMVLAPVDVSGLEPGWSATLALLQATLQLEGGRTLTSTSFSIPTPFMTQAAIRGVIGASDILSEMPDIRQGVAMLVVPESEFKQLAPDEGHYRGRFFLQLTHYVLEATLPVRPGAEARNGSYRLVVDAASTSTWRAVLRVRESDATSSFDRRPRVERKYYLRNQRSGEAIEGQIADFDMGILPRMIRGLSVSESSTGGFRAVGVGVWFPRGPVGRNVRIDDSWLRDADLVVVRSTREGGVERSLDIDDFPLKTTPPTETRSDLR